LEANWYEQGGEKDGAWRRETTERRQREDREREERYLTMIQFSSLCAVGRDSLPVGCQNLKVLALLKEE
jgi:hypothetical protein